MQFTLSTIKTTLSSLSRMVFLGSVRSLNAESRYTTDWLLLLTFLFLLILTGFGVGASQFFSVQQSITNAAQVNEGRPAPTLDKDALDKTLTILNQRSEHFDFLKTRPSVFVDPSK